MGCLGYADDLILLAPSRETMAKMLDVCERYALNHNLEFSTDPVPAKSKSKCLYMCGKKANVTYPAPLYLKGTPLPWVKTATHLGHELHQDCNMEHDVKVKRAQFINNCVEIRDIFSFAEPGEILRAVRVYAGHHYGSMLWDLDGEMCGQYCRSWSTCVKLTHSVPRSTHTYLVDHVLASGFLPIKTELMARYGNFYNSLCSSKSSEVRFMSSFVVKDIRSTTAKNLATIRRESGFKSLTVPSTAVRQHVPLTEVPVNQDWRLGLLVKLLSQRREAENSLIDTTLISSIIDSLCSS